MRVGDTKQLHFKVNTQRPFVADAARFLFPTAYKTRDAAFPFYFPGGLAGRPHSGSVFDFFAVYNLAGSFVSLTKFGSQNIHRHFKLVS